MSNIEWTGETWNFFTSCNMVSPGCANCYAELMSKRLKAMGQAKYNNATNGNGKWSGKVEFWPAVLDKPGKRKKPTTYFVNSMSDTFHPDVKNEWLEQIWHVMKHNPHHTFQLLTKRAHLMEIRARTMSQIFGVLPNVWLGVSVESQKWASDRIPRLMDTPAAIRFLSMEPLLAEVDLPWLRNVHSPDWVIVGGESGPGARPFHMEWAGKVVEDCQDVGIPVFVKQMGSKPYLWRKAVTGLGRKGNEPSLWPAGLNVRQMPEQRQPQPA